MTTQMTSTEQRRAHAIAAFCAENARDPRTALDASGHPRPRELLDAERNLGLRMDEDEQLHPEQSTAAIVVHHPQSRYFRV